MQVREGLAGCIWSQHIFLFQAHSTPASDLGDGLCAKLLFAERNKVIF